MFWKLTSLSASSPVESVLDKENFTLEELLDEEEIIQECRALNGRLINFLRDRTQVEQLLCYIVEEAPEDADSKRAFKFPFVACEIFTCEIDVIFKTLMEEELMDLLFSFLEPSRPHSALLAGYFSKVVICLMMRKTVPLMNYVQAHQDVFSQLVDLIGITSIMEVLIRLVGADDNVYPNYIDVMQWLADSNLLEMIVDKLNPYNPPEVHANAAETLCAIARTAPSPLATRLSSPSFVSRLFGHALEDAPAKSALVHSLSVFISLLDPRRSIPTSQIYSFRCQNIYESPVPVNSDTVRAMLPKLGDLLMLLSVSADAKILPTTFGELRPPLGKHRLKIVEFISVLLKSGNDVAEEELISTGTIQRILDLFFEYPYNNALHHNVECIIYSCLESKNDITVHHIFEDCDLVGKILQADKHPTLSGDSSKPTIPASGEKAPKAGYLGHLTRISNKLVQLENSDRLILAHIQENSEWKDWQTTVLQERNVVENVHRWGCGRPTAFQDRTRDSDEEDVHDRDYDVAALANNLSQAFRYNIYEEDDTEEGKGTLDGDDEDVYFDDESAEVVISSLRLGDDNGSSLFTNSNWFAFQDDRIGDSMSTSPPPGGMEEINMNGTSNGGSSGSEDLVVVGKDVVVGGSSGSEDVVVVGKDEELTEITSSGNISSSTNGNIFSGEKIPANGLKNDELFGHRLTTPEWTAWDETSDLQTGGFSINPFLDQTGGSNTNPFLNQSDSSINFVNEVETARTIPSDASTGEILPNGTSTSDSSSNSVASDSGSQAPTVPSLFEDDVEFVGVELEGTEKAMDHALKEGIVGEAGPMKRNLTPKIPEKESSEESGSGVNEFNDTNFWRVDQEVVVLE